MPTLVNQNHFWYFRTRLNISHFQPYFFSSDSKTSCDWSSCYDDVGFLEFLIERIGSRWCLDLDSIHLSGISNGGMFAYFLAAMSDDGIGKKIIFWQVF